MKKQLPWLSGLLIVQLVVAIGIYTQTLNQSQRVTHQPLLALETETIDKLIIVDEAQQITLNKKPQGWVLPTLNNLPVDHQKVTQRLNELTTLRTQFPVARKVTSHQQLHVSEDQFVKKIQLYSHDQLITEILLGSAPSFKKTHTRIVGNDDTYAFTINSYDYSTEQRDWLNKNLLAVNDITYIRGNDFELEKSGEQWTFPLSLQPHQDQQPPLIDTDKVSALNQALNTLQIIDIADEQAVLDEASVIDIQVTGKAVWHYQFSKKEKDCLVKRNDIALLFTVNKQVCDKITDIDKQSLIKVVTSTPANTQESLDDRFQPQDKNG